MTPDDILKLGPKLWALFDDPCIALDSGLFAILVAQVDLIIGTLSCFLLLTHREILVRPGLEFTRHDPWVHGSKSACHFKLQEPIDICKE